MNSLQDENRMLREQLAALKAEACANEAILRRAQARELELLKAKSIASLLERLVHYLADSFGVAAVTVVLLDPHHEMRHLLMAGGQQPEETEGIQFVDELTDAAPILGSLRQPWLGPYLADRHGPLFPAGSNPGSVALLPLRRRERVIGSLNLAAHDAQRFNRHLATDFLNHLAVIASFCLENAVNRARLVLSGLTDALTGLHNRRYLETRLQEEMARARRDRLPLACLLLDVDFFKRVNDSHGHLAGDRVLRELARRVGAHVRSSDVAARYGGEEFALLLPGTHMSDAVQLAERIREAVSASPIQVDEGLALTVTTSIGVANCTPAPAEEDLDALGLALLAAADSALYQAKATGRDRVCRAA